jgi:signal transduction histidine kinase
LSLPGLVLWYLTHWLPNSEFDPGLYPRVLAWCLGGVGAMLAFTFLRVWHPGVDVDWSLGTQAIAVAIGSVGGLAIGIREAEAETRAGELQRQNERLDEFTSIVSHDLRNPLNVAEGRLQLAREAVDSEHLAEVADAHDRMAALIEDMLSLARQGESIEDMEAVALPGVVDECWAGVAAPNATIEITAECGLLADESRLKQLLENLLRNAVEHGSTSNQNAARSDDAVEHGSTSPDSQARQDAVEHGDDGVTVTVGPLDAGDGFYVADDGPGIPEADMEAVFEHGYSSTRNGTGFGFAIVERISDAHGWTLTVTDSEDGGARFEFSDVTLLAADA